MVGNNYKVLIVDDVKENMQLVGNLLHEKNVVISFAENGKQAIKVALKKMPDLILLDINMPEMNGYETCKIIKADEKIKEIPIIFLSALSEKDNIVKGFKCGGVDYITKPFNKAELLSRVFTHLELKRSKELTKKQNNELIKLNETKDKFFSIIAHDLRNPFGAIMSLAQLIIKQQNTYTIENIIENIKSIYTACEITSKLLENLLMWARSQTGKIEYKPEKINIKKIVYETIFLLQRLAKQKEITINNKIIDDFYVFADFNSVNTIFRNLISNAIKYTPQRGTIVIKNNDADEIRNLQPENNTNKNNLNYALISIEDNGIGMSPELIDSLFYIGHKTSIAGTNGEQGTGLGLILCKEFVEMNNGKIWAESNNGSKFLFTLPIQ